MYDYAQTTFETCLACCLLTEVRKLRKISINQKLELACINHAMKYTKEDFVLGHLDFVGKRFGANSLRIVEDAHFYRYLKRRKPSAKTTLLCKKIGISLIDHLLETGCVIVLIDNFVQARIFHCPHYITILEKDDKTKAYTIYDPWEGERREIPQKKLVRAIASLRSHLKMSPQLIMV
jgi:hypothetical protein